MNTRLHYRLKSNNDHMIISFQGLRGYAILLIFISHCNINFADKENIFKYLWALGVSIFIMLSGYLAIYNMENKKNEFHLFKVLKRKLQKFYPLHILTLFLAIPLHYKELFVNPSPIAYGALGANVLLVQAWVPWESVYFAYNAVSWYLSLTLFLVIATPFIVTLIKKLNVRLLCGSAIAVFAFMVIWCGLLQKTLYAHWLIYILPLIRCLDFFLGGGNAYLRKKAV